MRTSDSLIPYQLMSMHPLLHASLLLTSGILLLTNKDDFFEVQGELPLDKECLEAKDFMENRKYQLTNVAVLSHIVGITCHAIYQLMNHYEVRILANVFLVAKMMIYLIMVLKIQSGIDYVECSSITDRSKVMAWLTYEVLAFYCNIISFAVFIFIQNIKKFRSIRDRLGLAGDMRKTTDFLTYAKDDVYWWSAWFVQFSLCVLGCLFRQNTDKIDITWSAVEVFL